MELDKNVKCDESFVDRMDGTKINESKTCDENCEDKIYDTKQEIDGSKKSDDHFEDNRNDDNFEDNRNDDNVEEGFEVITEDEIKESDVDAYGFRRGGDFDRVEYEAFFANYISVLARRASRWSDMVTHRESIARNSKLKRYCRKGIPGEFRATIWLHVSGAENGLRQNPELYAKLLKGPHEQELVDTIKADIPRTFPDNIYFKDVADPRAKQRPLYNVLVCLGTKNPNVGYCQGLNFIAGMLLLVVREEEKVFWLMDSLINHILPGYYSPDLIGVKTDIEVLEDLVKSKLPNVQRTLELHGVTLPLVVTKWFICCFADVMPVETVMRIWDCLFYEGSKIIFRVALTLIKHNQDKLTCCTSFPDVIDVFKAMPRDPIVTNCHKFIKMIFTEPGSLPKAKVKKLRQQNVEKIKKDS